MELSRTVVVQHLVIFFKVKLGMGPIDMGEMDLSR